MKRLEFRSVKKWLWENAMRDHYINRFTFECNDLRLENRRLASAIVKRGYLTTGEDCYVPTNLENDCADYCKP